MAVSNARILSNSVLSPRYSVLMCVLTSIFIIPCSIFVIRFFKVSFSIKLAAFQASGSAEPRTLNPEPRTLNPEP